MSPWSRNSVELSSFTKTDIYYIQLHIRGNRFRKNMSMNEKSLEVALLIPYASRQFAQVRTFLESTRSQFNGEQLKEIRLYCWAGTASLGAILSFSPEHFIRSKLRFLDQWAKDLQMDIIELNKLKPSSIEVFHKKFTMTSDVKFTGSYDLTHVLNEIEARFTKVSGVRRDPRVPARVKVRFKSSDAFLQEYTQNISFGGMFIQTTAQPEPRSRVELTIELPESGEEVKVIAEVVHVVNPEKANMLNGDAVPGVGIQFVEFIGAGEQKIKDFVKMLLETSGPSA